MIQVSESDMLFEFEENQIFSIENSRLHTEIGKGIKSVEFVVSLKEQEFVFIEAKSSSPQPTKDNQEKFDTFIQDVSDKFVHAFNMFLTAILRRYHDEAIPINFLEMNKQEATFKFILIIKGHQIEWLQPLQDAFSKSLLYHRKIWGSHVIVMNEELARDYRLVKE
ncbi:hypothetical protein [Metasolibacillus meyeri]|uniref:hypothetical protein n=1 Tax=Metasolibacillus meyeri TaxID=1071052 RepID=UPI00187D11B9|nr:hypothetical protein [Metasolibacillus meyeri]